MKQNQITQHESSTPSTAAAESAAAVSEPPPGEDGLAGSEDDEEGWVHGTVMRVQAGASQVGFRLAFYVVALTLCALSPLVPTWCQHLPLCTICLGPCCCCCCCF